MQSAPKTSKSPDSDSYADPFRQAWLVFKSAWVETLLLTLIAFGLTIAVTAAWAKLGLIAPLSILQGRDLGNRSALLGALVLTASFRLFFGIIIGSGLLRGLLHLLRGEPGFPFRHFLAVLKDLLDLCFVGVTSVLLLLLIVVGMLAPSILPLSRPVVQIAAVVAIYVQLGLSFASILVLDEGLDMFEAMRRSWKLVAGRRWEMAVLLISCLSISVAGALAMGLGSLITVPLSGLAFLSYYEQRRKQA